MLDRKLKYCHLFRIASVLIAMILFFTSDLSNGQFFVLLLISHVGFIWLYNGNAHIETRVFLLIGIEFLAICGIVVPTGGIQSFYFWTILNPMMTGLFLIKHPQKSVLLVGSFVCVLLLSGMVQTSPVLYYIGNAQLIFAYTAIILFITLLSRYNDELIGAQEEIEQALSEKDRLMEGMIHSVELVELLSTVDQRQLLLNYLKQYMEDVFPNATCFLLEIEEGSNFNIEAEAEIQSIVSKIRESMIEESREREHIRFIDGDNHEVGVYVHSNGTEESVLVLIVDDEFWRKEQALIKQQMLFLSRVKSIISAKLRLQTLAKSLFIREEQDRIARELHDKVNQDIFAVSCMAFNILNDTETPLRNDIRERIEKLYDILKQVNKNIKQIVYEVKVKDDSLTYLENYVRTFLTELAYVYDIQIHTELSDSDMLLDIQFKKALVRILTESVANAVRHGQANKVYVTIRRCGERLALTIRDNGKGFDTSKGHLNSGGLGISNMRRLAQHYGGKMTIESEPSQGTTVQIIVKVG